MTQSEENIRVLIIEDEKDINDLLALKLGRDGYVIDQAYDGYEGLQKALLNKYHVVVLDWMMPSMNGIDVLRKIREKKKSDELAILMATAKGQNEDIILGLECGADDYLSKPFDVSVLKARIKAVLRRSPAVSKPKQSIMTVGDLTINQDEHVVTCRGEKIDLTISEFKLLSSMIINYGKVLSRKELITEIQGEGVNVIDRSIDTHMVGLRKKLGHCSDLIKTVRGVGYKLQTGMD